MLLQVTEERKNLPFRRKQNQKQDEGPSASTGCGLIGQKRNVDKQTCFASGTISMESKRKNTRLMAVIIENANMERERVKTLKLENVDNMSFSSLSLKQQN